MRETIRGIVERVTFFNETNGWSVLKVSSFDGYRDLVTVTVHQTKVFAGATMEFVGHWTTHKKYGKQFKAHYATELKPATAAALEKYLGSGLIRGVGPKTAQKIVRHFGEQTLTVFEEHIDGLLEVPGIAYKKLNTIKHSWMEHRAVRDVMMFLQSHGISTLFAVRIYQQYGDKAISMVAENPYRLAEDFYGIGFFTADKVALSMGFADNSPMRISAGIRHVLSAARESGHCYLNQSQIIEQVNGLLSLSIAESIPDQLQQMERASQLCTRVLPTGDNQELITCYYAKSLYYDESYVAKRLHSQVGNRQNNSQRIHGWVERYCATIHLQLSREQQEAVCAIVNQGFSILTGGPGCGKTTTTKVLVALLQAMNLKVLLAAPTGRAAQRMGEVIGMEAKTIHRLLEFQGTRFQRCEENPLQADFIIVDECSMLDISLSASLLRGIAPETALLFIGDPDQLPSVGAGNVLKDCIQSGVIPCYHLHTIFRQASQSAIIQAAHSINAGAAPRLKSPFKEPGIWRDLDCFFIDSDEATKEQMRFIDRIKRHSSTIEQREELYDSPLYEPPVEGKQALDQSYPFIPEKYAHVDLTALAAAETATEQLMVMSKKIHPWSSLYFGLTALDVIHNLYTQWVPKYLGPETEIQVLAPMIRGGLGTANLNKTLQEKVNPAQKNKAELTLGERIFRVGDRVIHRRNNYDLNVFNGDIGRITAINSYDLTCTVSFLPENRKVTYNKEHLSELELAYAITVHKSQGSEFDAVIIPVVSQHFTMLFRNLLYTGLTRGKKLVVLVGTRKAFAMAVRNQDTSLRQTALQALLQKASSGRW
ncbi:MAG: recombinase RecD [Desulfobulbus propionicus]|nr:MAG: recombinase RecD [Desulfobulbus propionicus]